MRVFFGSHPRHQPSGFRPVRELRLGAMKRAAFRLTVSLITFSVGLVTTNLPQHPMARETGALSPLHVVPTPPSSVSNQRAARFEKVGNLPEAVDEETAVHVQFITERDGWVAINTKLWRTTDKGQTWSLQFTAPKVKADSGSIGNFQFFNARIGWMVASYHLYRTYDGGRHWEFVRQPIRSDSTTGFTVGITDLAFLAGGRRGWIVGSKYRKLTPMEHATPTFAVRYMSFDETKVLSSVIYFTDDGGENWISQPLESDAYDLYTIFTLGSQDAWTAGQSGFRYFQGDRWLADQTEFVDAHGDIRVSCLDTNIGAPTDAPSSIFFLNSMDGWLVNSNGYVGRTCDGGQHWADLPEGLGRGMMAPNRFGMEVYFADVEHGWGLDGDGKLELTKDGGVTWMSVDDRQVFSDMFFLDAKHGWVVSNDGVFRVPMENEGN